MFSGLIDWLENHEKLAGWAQFAGAMLAIFVTAWMAGQGTRARRSEEIQRMKALLHITTSVYTSARSLGDESNDRFLAGLTVRLQGLKISRSSLEQFQATGMTSTFMINNLVAAQGHTDRLIEIFSQLSLHKYDRAQDKIQTSLVGLMAICENIAREVRRLGGRRERHDDPQIALWFPLSLRERLIVWWNRRNTPPATARRKS